MDVTQAISERRAYRSLDPVTITPELVHDLARHAQLSASCFNNQPWRYVFVYDREPLARLYEALSPSNAWARRASLIVAVCSRVDLDCRVRDRDYYLFDTGMATAGLILRATELGLVAHPIAGYSQSRAREVLGIPEDMTVITLLIAGRRANEIHPELSEKQREQESSRPPRRSLAEFAFHNRYPVSPSAAAETPSSSSTSGGQT